MALTNCRECGKEVSRDAPKCPHCGAQDPYLTKTQNTVYLLIITAIVVAGGFIFRNEFRQLWSEILARLR